MRRARRGSCGCGARPARRRSTCCSPCTAPRCPPPRCVHRVYGLKRKTEDDTVLCRLRIRWISWRMSAVSLCRAASCASEPAVCPARGPMKLLGRATTKRLIAPSSHHMTLRSAQLRWRSAAAGCRSAFLCCWRPVDQRVAVGAWLIPAICHHHQRSPRVSWSAGWRDWSAAPPARGSRLSLFGPRDWLSSGWLAMSKSRCWRRDGSSASPPRLRSCC